jgi:hypothetical protein
MAEELFSVGVSLYIIDRISRDLMMITRQFGAGDAAVRRMQMSINALQNQHTLLGRRLTTNQQIEARNLELMAERAELARRSAKTEAQLLNVRQMDARIDATMARQAIRDAEVQNRLAQQRIEIAERNIALTQAQARANREATMASGQRMLVGGAVGAGIGIAGLYGLGRLLGAGFPIEQKEFEMRLAGRLTPMQTQAMSQRALQVSQALGVISYADELTILQNLLATQRNPQIAGQLLLPISQAADVIAQLPGKGSAIDASVALAQLSNLFGAHTAAQGTQVGTMALNLLRQTGSNISIAQIMEAASYMGGVIPGKTMADKLRNFSAIATLSARVGGLQSGVSARNLAHFEALMTQTMPGRQIAAVSLLEQYGLAKEPQQRTLSNQLMAIRRLAAAHPGMTGIPLVAQYGGGEQIVRLMALLSQVDPATIEAINRAEQNQITIQEAWRESMELTVNQWTRVKTNFDSLAATIGKADDANLAPFFKSIGDMVQSMGDWAGRNPADVVEISKAFAAIAGSFAIIGTGVAIAGLVSLATVITGIAAAPFLAGVAALAGLIELIEHWGQIKQTIQHDYQAVKKYPHNLMEGLRTLGAPLSAIGPTGGGIYIDQATIHVHGVQKPHEVAHAIANGLRTAITRTGQGSGVYESPLFHNKETP